MNEQTEPAPEKIVREHVTTLHLIGEQLAQVESWFWQHLADVREAVSSSGPAPATDRDTLRQQIAAALYERERPPRDPHWPDVYASDREVFEAMADVVLAVLPAPDQQTAELANLRTMYDAVSARENDLIKERDQLREAQSTVRTAVLREAADELGRMDYDTDSNDYGYDTYRDAWNGGVMDGAGLLRRMAGEAHRDPTQDGTAAALLATPCDACDHTLNWHRNDVGCTVPRCVCGRWQPAVARFGQPETEA